MIIRPGITSFFASVAITVVIGACSTMKSIFSPGNSQQTYTPPIQNPFADYYSNPRLDKNQAMILRTKKGDRAVEVELPKTSQEMTDFVIPVSPAFKESNRAPAGDASGTNLDDTYKDRSPTMTDREITGGFPQGMAEDDGKRREIEQGLGLVPSDGGTPDNPRSYLAAIDHVKQLYKYGRYEAALIETDEMIKEYQTDPKLYEMRGTLLDRLGKTDLAIKSWNQSLRFNPSNAALKKFVERRQQHRSTATQ